MNIIILVISIVLQEFKKNLFKCENRYYYINIYLTSERLLYQTLKPAVLIVLQLK